LNVIDDETMRVFEPPGPQKRCVVYKENGSSKHSPVASDHELVLRLTAIVAQSRRVEAELVAHIAEVDRRRLYLETGCSSMFTYCTEVLHLSEPEAYLRIQVGRTARRFPVVLAMLEEGRLHLSGIALLSPHLTDENCEKLLARAGGRSKRQIEELTAELAPKPDVPPTIRRLPAPPPPRPVQLRPDGAEISELAEPLPAGARKTGAATIVAAAASFAGALQGHVHREPRAQRQT
jgi:hypothetical protein